MEKSVRLFYTSPREESFNELKEVCIRFWKTFDNEFGYSSEKINRIKDLPNDGPNFVMMVQMIHPVAREVISKLLSLETRNEISMRMYGWEEENEFDHFNIWNIDNNITQE